MTKEKTMRTYFAMVVDGKNHITYYLFNSTHKRGTWDNRFDGNCAIEKKTGSYPKWYNGKVGIKEDWIYLDTAKNREEQCFGEDNSTVIDCR